MVDDFSGKGRWPGSPPKSGYLPIEEHGVVGDLRTVALVGTDGTVDWYCPARFDAPSLFGSLLDARKGGYFGLSGRSNTHPKQFYLPNTNILLTRFHGIDEVGELIDFMVPQVSATSEGRDRLVRRARSVRGRTTFELACHPAFDYGRVPHTVQVVTGVGAVFTAGSYWRRPQLGLPVQLAARRRVHRLRPTSGRRRLSLEPRITGASRRHRR